MKKDKIYLMYKSCSAEITSRTNEIQHLLLGEGNFDATIMVIAEVPTSKEEEYHQNLLEDQREELSKILKPLGCTIEDVYITHLMKYRPYRINSQGRIVSRAPQKEELDFFIPYLEKEISLVNPKLIITLGDVPLQYLTKDFTLKLNTAEDQLLVVGVLGKSYKLYPMYHPLSKSFAKSVERFLTHDVSRVNQLFNNQGMHIANTIQEAASLSTSNPQQKSGMPLNNQIADTHTEIQSNNAELSDTKKRVYQKIKASKNDTQTKGTKAKNRYVTIVYGGEGYSDDPTLVAIDRITKVFNELEVGVNRVDLHKGKPDMAKVFGFIEESKGVLLALNVEWYGIGQRMQGFLDDCFFHGERSYFEGKVLFGLCFSRHGFERDAYQHLLKSWEIIGGAEGISLLATLKSAAQLETNFDWLYGIDKKTEAYFRMLQQDKGWLPISKITDTIHIETPISTNPQINEPAGNSGNRYGDSLGLNQTKSSGKVQPKAQEGLIEDYDAFVVKQQQDIKEISSLIKRKLSTKTVSDEQSLPKLIKDAYVNKEELTSSLQLVFEDQSKENTVIELNNQHIRAYYGQRQDVDVTIVGNKETFYKIFNGKLTMQRAFMTGEIKAKGDFTILYKFETYFKFGK